VRSIKSIEIKDESHVGAARRVFGAPERASLISANGTLGARLGKLRVWSGAWSEGATLIMTSDGLSAIWDLESYPGLLEQSP